MNQILEPEARAVLDVAPFETLADRLDIHAANRPDQLAFIFLDERGEEVERLTFAQLTQRSAQIATGLQTWRGQRALMLYSPGSAFICALLACFRAGVVAVPMPLPGRQKRGMARVAQVAQNARASLVLTDNGAFDVVLAGLAATVIHDLPCLSTEDLAESSRSQLPETFLPEDQAYLQYTSGSTGEPKGVIITHGALMHNLEVIRLKYQHSTSSITGSWLPTFHDMGLVGAALQSVFTGSLTVQMSPMTFIKRPVIWLQTISKYRVTMSGGPNFAFDLCTHRIPPGDLEGLDLSSWVTACNGAEPIRATTLRAFSKRFAAYGFDAQAFFPCYGLAETTLMVTGSTLGRGPTVLKVNPTRLEQGEVQTVGEDEVGRELVGCGTAVNLDVRIVDPGILRPVAEGRVGEIWVRGGSVGAGYWERPDLTEATFRAFTSTDEGPFLRTGDLGFLYGGELFMTGRIKDLMIVSGRNIYPQDVEAAALQAHPSLRSAAAFTVDTGEREVVALVLEVGRTEESVPAGLTESLRQTVGKEFGVSVAGVLFVTTANFARTTSGKVMRGEMRRKFLEQTLDTVHEDVYDELDQVRHAQLSPV